MLAFLSVALLVYGTMHLYALGKVWLAVPHSFGLGLVLTLVGLILTFSPLLVWLLERRGWHHTAAAAAWVSYAWMGYLFLFVCLGLLFDLGNALATLSALHWPLTVPMTLRLVGLLALALWGYGFAEARALQVERITITTPKLATGRLTLAQLSDLHLGLIRRDKLLDRIVTELHALKPDILVATGDIVNGQRDDLHALVRHSTPIPHPSALTPSPAITNTTLGWITPCAFCMLRALPCCAAHRPRQAASCWWVLMTPLHSLPATRPAGLSRHSPQPARMSSSFC